MNCKKCGAPLVGEDKFCKNCGTPVENVQPQVTTQPEASVQTPTAAPIMQPEANVTSTVAPIEIPTMASTMVQPTPVVNNNNNTKKDNSRTILIALLALVAVIGVVIIVLLLTKNNTNDGLTGGDTATPKVEDNVNVDKTPEVTPSKISSTYKVNYGNFVFNIPDDLIYNLSDGALLVGDSESTWQAILKVGQSSYEGLKANMANIQSGMIQQGYNSSPATIKTLGGVEYITMELSSDGQNIVGAYSKLNSMNVIMLVICNLDNSFDYSILEKVAPIISTSTYQGVTNNIENHINIDLTPGLELGR